MLAHFEQDNAILVIVFGHIGEFLQQSTHIIKS